MSRFFIYIDGTKIIQQHTENKVNMVRKVKLMALFNYFHKLFLKKKSKYLTFVNAVRS